MRIGDGKVIEQTSGKWRGDQVGSAVFGPGCTPVAPLRQDARQIAERSVALRSPQDLRNHAIRAAWIRLAQGLDELKEALYHEQNEDGPFQQPILDTQENVREAMRGCQAMLAETAKK